MGVGPRVLLTPVRCEGGGCLAHTASAVQSRGRRGKSHQRNSFLFLGRMPGTDPP